MSCHNGVASGLRSHWEGQCGRRGGCLDMRPAVIHKPRGQVSTSHARSVLTRSWTLSCSCSDKSHVYPNDRNSSGSKKALPAMPHGRGHVCTDGCRARRGRWHLRPREVAEPMAAGEAAGDALRLAEMQGLVGPLLLAKEALQNSTHQTLRTRRARRARRARPVHLAEMQSRGLCQPGCDRPQLELRRCRQAGLRQSSKEDRARRRAGDRKRGAERAPGGGAGGRYPATESLY